MTDVPAMLLGCRSDVLAMNALASALYLDWEANARLAVAHLHIYAGRRPHDPKLAALVGELSVRDADFRRWWADNDVYLHAHGTKALNHPVEPGRRPSRTCACWPVGT